MAKMTVPAPVVLPLPTFGLDESTAFELQPRNTTASAVNVRPKDTLGRGTLSRRPGTSKYLAEQIADGPIQDISTITVARDQTAGTGDVFGQGVTATAVDIRGVTAGAVNGTLGELTVQDKNNLGCVDEDGNFYVAAIASGSVQIKKIGTDYAVKWTRTLTTSGGTGSIYGLAAVDGIVYLLLADTAAPGIYRFLTSSGAPRDSGVWLTTGLATVTGLSKSFQGIAAGGGLLGIAGKSGSNFVLQIVVLATGAIASTTTLQAFDAYPSKVITDAGSNFYVLTNAAGTGATGNRIYKVSYAGSILWTVSDTSTGARDIAYDPVNFMVGVVGTAIFPNVIGAAADDSMQTYSAVTGALVSYAGSSHGKPGSVTAWDAIAADGLVGTSAWRLRRSVAAGSVDIISTAAPAATVNWSVTSNSGVFTGTPTLWLICSGKNVAPAPSPMRSSRLTRILVVCNGGLYRADGGTVSNITSNFLSPGASVVFSAMHQLKLYYVDGSSYRIYDGSINTVSTLVASSGLLPADPNGNKCRIIEGWRGRLIFSGLKSDPHNWFMPAQGDPTNFNYAPDPYVSTAAIAGSNAPCGKCPDMVQGVIPLSDDLALFGCDHSIYRLSGDPAFGGRFDLVSSTTGMAFGRAWCLDPEGTIYFYGSRGRIWRLKGNGVLQPISMPIDSSRLFDIDLSAHQVTMSWDDRWQGLHVFITPYDPTLDAVHYWWDANNNAVSPMATPQPSGGWWPDEFANKLHNPLTAHMLDGDDPADRRLLLAGRDGYIRVYDDEAESDDGYPITSQVFLGPLLFNGGAATLTDLQMIMATDSADVGYGVRVGESAAAAFASESRDEGIFAAGRNRSQAIRAFGHAAYVVLGSSEIATRWSVESLRAVVVPLPAGAGRRF